MMRVTIYHLLLEYLLILKLHVQSLYTSVPREWSAGHKGDVILLPGFFETWVFLATIGTELNKTGFRIHVLPALEYNTLPLDTCVQIVNDYIQTKKLDNTVLLSHSKGGLVAKLFLDTHSGGHRSVSIATPYKGTLLGYLHFFNLKELTPNSKKIKLLLSHSQSLRKITNLYAGVDNHILPNRNAILPGANNMLVDVTGHTRILHDPQTIQIIRDSLTR